MKATTRVVPLLFLAACGAGLVGCTAGDPGTRMVESYFTALSEGDADAAAEILGMEPEGAALLAGASEYISDVKVGAAADKAYEPGGNVPVSYTLAGEAYTVSVPVVTFEPSGDVGIGGLEFGELSQTVTNVDGYGIFTTVGGVSGDYRLDDYTGYRGTVYPAVYPVDTDLDILIPDTPEVAVPLGSTETISVSLPDEYVSEVEARLDGWSVGWAEETLDRCVTAPKLWCGSADPSEHFAELRESFEASNVTAAGNINDSPPLALSGDGSVHFTDVIVEVTYDWLAREWRGMGAFEDAEDRIEDRGTYNLYFIVGRTDVTEEPAHELTVEPHFSG